MSVPHLTAPVQAPTAAAAARALRGQGLRLSAARRVVLAALFAADRPLSAEEIAAGAAVRAAVGFEPRFHPFPLAGLCSACAARTVV